MPASTPTRSIAAIAAKLSFADLPAAAVARAKHHILDAVGLGFAAHAHDFATCAIAGVEAMGASGTCSVIGLDRGFDQRDAAMLNGILIHGLDFDDTHLASIIHATATALPAALAVAETVNASGEELLTAFLLGAETAIRIGLAVDGGFHHVGFHATGVVSHFASAMTAGKLLGLDEVQLVSAMGIAGSTASGIQVFLEEGAWTKRFHPGWGAVAGINAAYLARAGFKGPSRPFDGRFGLFDTHLHVHRKDVKMEALTDGFGKLWRFEETALKPYPVCHFIHGCADAAIELHHEIGGAEIASVTAFLPQPTLHIIAEPAEEKERPGNEYEVKFSAQFVVAACLLKGHFDLPDLSPEAMVDPKVRELATRVKCKADPESQFPTYFSGGVTVQLADGRELKRHVPVNSGAGPRALTQAALMRKFNACASLTISAERAAEVATSILAMERLSAREIAAKLRQR